MILSHLNDMDPFPKSLMEPLIRDSSFPLPVTKIEEMLMAQAYPIMKIFRLENGSSASHGNVLNVEQDIGEVRSAVFPVLLNELSVLVVRKRNSPGHPVQYKEFLVRSGVIQAWLRFLKANNTAYEHIITDEQRLSALPDNDYVTNDLRSTTEDMVDAIVEDARSTQQSTDSVSTGTRSNDETVPGDPVDFRELGPEQGGATGLPVDEQSVLEEHLGLPLRPVHHQNQCDNTVHRRFGPAQNQVDDTQAGPSPASQPEGQRTISWPSDGAALHDYDIIALQSKLFPTLFLFGSGDVYLTSREFEVSLTMANRHLLNYTVQDSNGRLWFPFASHRRWMHWVHNTTERRRQQG